MILGMTSTSDLSNAAFAAFMDREFPGWREWPEGRQRRAYESWLSGRLHGGLSAKETPGRA